MALINFNATAIDTSSHDTLPPGVYEAMVTASELKPTRDGSGQGINLTFTILSGEAQNRKVWTWINYQHAKPDVQRIGQQELARLCRAVGIASLTATEQLHNLPVMITVGVDRSDPTRNVVKGYAARASAAAPAPVQAPQTAAPQPAAGTAPWAR